jgi:hypothetical protein
VNGNDYLSAFWIPPFLMAAFLAREAEAVSAPKS